MLSAILTLISVLYKLFFEKETAFVNKAFLTANVYMMFHVVGLVTFYHFNTGTLASILNEMIAFEKRYVAADDPKEQHFWNIKNNKSVKFVRFCIQHFRTNYVAVPITMSVTTLIFPTAPWSLLPKCIVSWELSEGEFDENITKYGNILIRFIAAYYTYCVWRLGSAMADLSTAIVLTTGQFCFHSFCVFLTR